MRGSLGPTGRVTHATRAGGGEGEEERGWARMMGLEEGSIRCGRGPTQSTAASSGAKEVVRVPGGLRSGARQLSWWAQNREVSGTWDFQR